MASSMWHVPASESSFNLLQEKKPTPFSAMREALLADSSIACQFNAVALVDLRECCSHHEAQNTGKVPPTETRICFDDVEALQLSAVVLLCAGTIVRMAL